MGIQYAKERSGMEAVELEAHPAADIFPMMDGKSFQEFTEDIRQQGLREAIILLDGKILDGRNRHKACIEAGVSPRFETYHGNDPTGFVISLNLKRRHLTESQRAMIAGKLATLKKGNNQHSPIGECSQSEAANMLNVGKRSVERAKLVQSKGVPELVEAVERGDVSVSAASVIAGQPEQVQDMILSEKDKKRLAKAAKGYAEAVRLNNEMKALPKARPLTPEERASNVKLFGTQEIRARIAMVFETAEMVKKLPSPQDFIAEIPPAYEINESLFKMDELRAVTAWFGEFCETYKPKENANVTIEHVG